MSWRTTPPAQTDRVRDNQAKGSIQFPRVQKKRLFEFLLMVPYIDFDLPYLSDDPPGDEDDNLRSTSLADAGLDSARPSQTIRPRIHVSQDGKDPQERAKRTNGFLRGRGYREMKRIMPRSTKAKRVVCMVLLVITIINYPLSMQNSSNCPADAISQLLPLYISNIHHPIGPFFHPALVAL
jgi:hypothetical protein